MFDSCRDHQVTFDYFRIFSKSLFINIFHFRDFYNLPGTFEICFAYVSPGPKSIRVSCFLKLLNNDPNCQYPPKKPDWFLFKKRQLRFLFVQVNIKLFIYLNPLINN